MEFVFSCKLDNRETMSKNCIEVFLRGFFSNRTAIATDAVDIKVEKGVRDGKA